MRKQVLLPDRLEDRVPVDSQRPSGLGSLDESCAIPVVYRLQERSGNVRLHRASGAFWEASLRILHRPPRIACPIRRLYIVSSVLYNVTHKPSNACVLSCPRLSKHHSGYWWSGTGIRGPPQDDAALGSRVSSRGRACDPACPFCRFPEKWTRRFTCYSGVQDSHRKRALPLERARGAPRGNWLIANPCVELFLL